MSEVVNRARVQEGPLEEVSPRRSGPGDKGLRVAPDSLQGALVGERAGERVGADLSVSWGPGSE